MLIPKQVKLLIETIIHTIYGVQNNGFYPVLLCSPKIRKPLYELLVRHSPAIVVISYSELIPEINIELVATVLHYP
jgi:flagellar biosynthesis protein FlhA